ncbi:MAG TPA: hypothetical protein VGH79_02260 [Gaiellaceae bacterium]|jgi:hypothetical protein
MAAQSPVQATLPLPPGTRHFVVVYQLGKVASTALVSSLSEIPGVVAVQSHFLGMESFSGIIRLIVDGVFSDYSADHNLGQLNQNVAIERTITAVRSGKHPEVAATILSLSREPLDWFRSAVVQDIDGYRAGLREIAGSPADASDDEAIVQAIPAVCEEIASLYEESDGVDGFLARDFAERNAWLRQRVGTRHAVLSELFLLFLRPHSWFDQHFAKYLGVGVPELPTIAPQVYRGDLGSWARTYVIRYEDIGSSIPIVLDDIGIAETFQLTHENVSGEKNLASAVREGLSAGPLDRLRALSNASSYARQFGYAA